MLASVAKHERELLEKIDASKEEARNIIERARSDARKHLQSEDAALNEEVARIRRESEEARLQAFAATVAEAEQRLVSVREGALKRAPEIAKSMVGLVVPSGSKGK